MLKNKFNLEKAIASNANILIAVLIWILGFFILWVGMKLSGIEWMSSKIMIIIAIIVSGIFAFGDYDRVELFTNKKLLFRGEETPYRAESGFFFTFWFWSLDVKEVQTIEKLDVVISSFDCQDKNGKALKSEGNGDWKIVSRNRYELFDANKMVENLDSLIKKTTIKEAAKLPYRAKTAGQAQILGEELGTLVLANAKFKSECRRYGVRFTNLIINAIAADLVQENLNAYAKELFEEEKAKYPTDWKFTHKQLEEIEARVQVRVKLAKRIITNSALLGRFDVV